MRGVTTVVCLAAGLAGCKPLEKMPDLKEYLPQFWFSEVKVDALDFQKLDGKLVLEVKNPYPVGLSLKQTDWKLGLAGHPFLDGTNTDGMAIAPSETSKVRIPFVMKFVDAYAVATGLEGSDAIPFTFDAELGFDTPIGPVKAPLHHQGEFPALHAPKVRLKALRVEKLDVLKNQARLALDLNLHNEAPSAIVFETFGWGLKLAGADVASGNTVIGSVTGDQEVTLPIDLDLVGMGEAIVAALTKKTELKVRLTADAEVGTPFGVVPLSVDEVADLIPR